MIIRKLNRDYYTDEGHLHDNYIALYVDALILDKVEALPIPVLEHVEDCMKCKTGNIELFEILKDHEEIKNRKHPYFHRASRGSQSQWIKMAAVFLGFIVIAAFIYYMFDQQKDYQKMYAQNFEPYDDVITESGTISTAYDTMFYSILTDYYNVGDYERANFLFGKLYNQGKPNDSLLFYYGVSSLALGESLQAINLFKEMTHFERSIFYNQSRWYLALAYLRVTADSKGENRQEMITNSKKILQEIIDKKSDYAEKAGVLLSDY